MFEKSRRAGTLLLDGATGTNLYLCGLPQGVCVEEWILSHPQAILDLQSGFAAAGSDAVYAPTFGANRIKLAHYGLSDRTAELNKALVKLSKEAAPGCYIGGDLSPTGTFLEPFGESTLDEVVMAYREQAEALNEAGVDFFAVETMMSLAEARAAVLGCRDFGKPVFVTITVNEEGRTLTGASLENVLAVMQELGVSACGLNCSCPPAKLYSHVKQAMQLAKIPLIVKPNAGMPDPSRPGHYDLTPEQMAADMKKLVEGGVSIIGGCCGNREAHIAALREMLDHADIKPFVPERTGDILLADESTLYRLKPGYIRFSEEIPCDEELMDSLLDALDDEADCALVRVNTEEEAHLLMTEAAQVHIPICVASENEAALRRAAFLYTGRLMVKTDCGISCAEYGAVPYEE